MAQTLQAAEAGVMAERSLKSRSSMDRSVAQTQLHVHSGCQLQDDNPDCGWAGSLRQRRNLGTFHVEDPNRQSSFPDADHAIQVSQPASAARGQNCCVPCQRAHIVLHVAGSVCARGGAKAQHPLWQPAVRPLPVCKEPGSTARLSSWMHHRDLSGCAHAWCVLYQVK